MARPNTTGLPNTNDYVLGRGIVYAAAISAVTGLPQAWRDLGNSPDFKISVASETLEHKSSRAGLKNVDKSVTISKDTTVNFTLDEVNQENVAYFFSGTTATPTNGAVAGFSLWAMIPTATLAKGRWYDVVSSTGVRAYDISAGDFLLKTSNVSPVTLVLGTDYLLDTEFGRVFLMSTSTAIGTAITNGESLTVTLTAKAGAKGIDEVRALMSGDVKVALKFIAENPANSNDHGEYEFHQVILKANGDFSLISDDWTAMPFTAKAEANTLGFPLSPYMTTRSVKTA